MQFKIGDVVQLTPLGVASRAHCSLPLPAYGVITTEPGYVFFDRIHYMGSPGIGVNWFDEDGRAMSDKDDSEFVHLLQLSPLNLLERPHAV